MHVAAWHRRTLESKFTKFGEEMSIGQTPNHAKFCGDMAKNVRDISGQKFVLPKKGTMFIKIFQGMLLTKAPNQPKFCLNQLKKCGRYLRSKICAP